MTNIASGQKRSWEEAEIEASRRARDRDWRDVHLKSSPRKPSGRPHGLNRRSPGYHDDNGRRGGETRTRAHDSRRHIDSYNKDDRNRGHFHRSRSPQPRGRSQPTVPRIEDEKEEGEISPRASTSPEPYKRLPSSAPPLDSNGTQLEGTKEPEMELDLPLSPPPVEDILAARRAKRQAILAKYTGIVSVSASISSGPGPTSAAQSPVPDSFSGVSDLVSQNGVNGHVTKSMSKLDRRDSVSVSPTPRDFTLVREDGSSRIEYAGEQVSAVDYDPCLDRREDEQKRFGVDRKVETIVDDGDDEMEVEEDVDDMFALSTTKKKFKKAKDPPAPALITTATLDTAADPEGYYNVILGEQLDGGKYQVFSSIGKGMFANVVRARILKSETGDIGREVAIKIIRRQESMYRAGQKETQMLNKLRQADPEDKKHIVRLERTFEHRGHLCLVFEAMSMNLRDVLKRFGKDVGLNIRAVRAYAHQLFLALSLMRKLNIMHADIKPDNILVNDQKTLLKLCDLGSASDAAENEITPYLVSRFYRAPEIILGVPYDPALDIWSVGCTLYELYTGKILLPGRSNNQMLLLMMELKGRLNSKMIKKAKFGDVYFDDMGGFESVEKDRITGNDVVRKVHVSKASRDLRMRLMPPGSSKTSDEETKLITSFIDLLDKCLALDPTRRITPREALTHPFIRG